MSGYDEGFEDGYKQGKDHGWAAGYNQGLSHGRSNPVTDADYEKLKATRTALLGEDQ